MGVRGKQLRQSWLRFAAVFSLFILSACGGEQASTLPPQKWQALDVRVESRPNPPRVGMNEFLVMVTGERGRPAHDLVVSLRTDDHDVWTQAIQDGQLGIYRRAVEVAPGVRSVLQVQVKRNGEEGILRFPLQLPGGTPQ
mgnify:CR=1 FL=1